MKKNERVFFGLLGGLFVGGSCRADTFFVA